MAATAMTRTPQPSFNYSIFLPFQAPLQHYLHQQPPAAAASPSEFVPKLRPKLKFAGWALV